MGGHVVRHGVASGDNADLRRDGVMMAPSSAARDHAEEGRQGDLAQVQADMGKGFSSWARTSARGDVAPDARGIGWRQRRGPTATTATGSARSWWPCHMSSSFPFHDGRGHATRQPRPAAREAVGSRVVRPARADPQSRSLPTRRAPCRSRARERGVGVNVGGPTTTSLTDGPAPTTSAAQIGRGAGPDRRAGAAEGREKRWQAASIGSHFVSS